MEPEVIDRSLIEHGEITSGMFGLSRDNEAHIIHILRSTLYTNKELAVLREYATNAWDAHVMAGLQDFPIKVVLPTELDHTLTIRDYGAGMDEETVYGVYAQYGESTKRTSNQTVGYLGIGSKSAFAYSDTFTITSFNGGRKTLYLAVIDESNRGKLTKVHEESWPSEDTGIEISVPVNPADVEAFHREAAWLFQYFQPLPTINIPLTPSRFQQHLHGFLDVLERDDVAAEDYDYGRRPRAKTLPVPDLQWVAIMGCVPYRLNFTRMLQDLQGIGLDKIVQAIGGGLRFDIGEVSVSASREELEYTARTRAAVISKLRRLFKELVGSLTQTVDDSTVSEWAKRVAVTTFFANTRLPVPDKFAPWADSKVELHHHKVVPLAVDGDGNQVPTARPTVQTYTVPFLLSGYLPKKNRLGGHSPDQISARLTECTGVSVTPVTRLVIRDTTAPLSHYTIVPSDRVVTPREGVAIEELIEVLPDVLAKFRILGIPTVRLSEMQPRVVRQPKVWRPRGPVPAKHKETFFVLKEGTLSHHTPLSDNWEVVERIPKKSDVFVILSHFNPTGKWEPFGQRRRYTNYRRMTDFGVFYEIIEDDRRMLGMLGVKFPPIYAVKTTVKAPVNEEDLKGTPYAEWRRIQFDQGLDRQVGVRARLEDYYWHVLFKTSVGNNARYGRDPHEVLHALQAELSLGHPLRVLFEQQAAATERYMALTKGDQHTVCLLARWQAGTEGEAPPTSEAVRFVETLLARYPLLASKNGGPSFSVFAGNEYRTHWFEYIHLIDRTTP